MTFEFDAFERDGYAVLCDVFNKQEIGSLQQRWNELVTTEQSAGTVLTGGMGGVYGVRNLLTLWPDGSRCSVWRRMLSNSSRNPLTLSRNTGSLR